MTVSGLAVSRGSNNAIFLSCVSVPSCDAYFHAGCSHVRAKARGDLNHCPSLVGMRRGEGTRCTWVTPSPRAKEKGSLSATHEHIVGEGWLPRGKARCVAKRWEDGCWVDKTLMPPQYRQPHVCTRLSPSFRRFLAPTLGTESPCYSKG